MLVGRLCNISKERSRRSSIDFSLNAGLRIFFIPLNEPVGLNSRLMNGVEATVLSTMEFFLKTQPDLERLVSLALVDVEVVFARYLSLSKPQRSL